MKGTILAASAAAFSFMPVAGFAQQQDGANELEEIVVTANRREQALQDVAGAVTALTGTEIEAQGIVEFADFVTRVPGVNYYAASSSENEITMRGISLAGGRIATVAVYIDEMPVTGSSFEQPGMSTFDVNRVEVLRGPQGTLYGEASLGGTIKFIYNKPQLDAFSGKLSLDGSSTAHGGDNHNLGAILNMPLVEDKAAIRLSVQDFSRDGYVDHNRTGTKDVNGEEYIHARLSGRFVPTDSFTIDASLVYHDGSNEGQNFSAPDYTTDRYLVFEPFDDEYTQGNVTLTYDWDTVSLISSTSMWDREQSAVFDLPSNLPLVNGLIIPFGQMLGLVDVTQGPVDQTGVQTSLSSEIFTQELRLSGAGSDRVDWTAGVFFKDTSTGRVNEASTIPEIATTPPELDAFLRDEDNDYQTTAVFGELSYNFTERLTGTVGVRWFNESRDTRSLTSGYTFEVLNAIGLPVAIGEVTSSSSDDEVTPKFNLAYSFDDDKMIYGTVSKGFRGGGNNAFANFNNPAGTDPETYGPDSLWNYEIGAKTVWNDSFTMNVAVFLIDWDNAQINIGNFIGINIIDNAAAVETQGVEVEAILHATDNLEFTFAGGWVDAETKGDSPAAPDGTPLGDVADYNINVGGRYSFPIGSLNGFFQANVNAVGARPTFTGVGAPEADSYTLTNIGFGIQGDSWSVTAYGNNISDERAQLTTIGTDVFSPVEHFIYYQPRTIGVRAVFDW